MTKSYYCYCGSGLWRRELKDAAGTFCTFICDNCERAARAKFKQVIFDIDTPYAMTGEESDIPPEK